MHRGNDDVETSNTLGSECFCRAKGLPFATRRPQLRLGEFTHTHTYIYCSQERVQVGGETMY